MAGQLKVIADVAYLANAAANIYAPAASTIYTVIYQIHIANVTNAARTATLYKGATGASVGGTELIKGLSIAANSEYDRYWPKGLKMLSTDFLVGLADASSSLVILVLGEQIVA